MYNISMGGGRSENSSHKSSASSSPSSNPFTPANDPLKNLYPNASSGREALSGESNPYTQPQGTGAATKSSSGKDISFLYGSSGSTHSSGSSGRAKKEEFDWLNADMAKHYDMSKETGYAEAMENTSYQRAVKDMKAAGLNPAVLFGANAGDGSGVPNYIRGASSGGGGGSGGGYSGRSYSSGYKWSKSQYGAFSGAGAVIGGLVGAVTSKSARGAAAGATAGAAIGSGIAKILNIF